MSEAIHEALQEDVGIVTAISGKMVTVEIMRSGGCKSCSMQGFCFKKNEPVSFSIPSELELEVNDQVQLEISPEGRVLASLLVFGVPMAALFLGYLLFSLWLSELGAILVSFGTMALSILLVKWLDKKLGGNLKVTISRKL